MQQPTAIVQTAAVSLSAPARAPDHGMLEQVNNRDQSSVITDDLPTGIALTIAAKWQTTPWNSIRGCHGTLKSLTAECRPVV
jgi:hypothetical protein